jgi:hypothetical protein
MHAVSSSPPGSSGDVTDGSVIRWPEPITRWASPKYRSKGGMSGAWARHVPSLSRNIGLAAPGEGLGHEMIEIPGTDR